MTEVRQFNQLIASQPKNGPSATQIAESRIASGKSVLSVDSGAAVKQTVQIIKSNGNNLQLLVFRPDTVRAVVLEIHGGGWFLGSANDDKKFAGELAKGCKVAVVCVNYRLAPENPFPACVEDCEAAAKWLVENSKNEFGTDQIFVSGFSAGAHLAAVTTLYIRDTLHTISKVKGLNVFYGIYDLGKTPSFRLATDSSVLSKKFMDEMMELVFGTFTISQLQAPQYSPLFANLHNLPPALFSIGAADPLADDTYFMENRWRSAGNKTYLAVYPQSPHGFDLFPTKLAALSHNKVVEWMNDLLKEP